MTDALGFATTAASTGDKIIGVAEKAVDNSAGVAGALFVPVKINAVYPKP
jgi:hypothetical protein